jgi:NAD+ kinase
MLQPIDLRRVAISAYPQMHKAINEAAEVAAFLENMGLETEQCALTDDSLREEMEAGKFDLLIALGGDGTMLRAGHLCGPTGVPLLGINMGKFGFLTEIGEKDWRQMLPNLVQGSYRLEHRMMLCAEHWRGETQLGAWQVLNEVVVGRGYHVRPVHFQTFVDDRFLTTYVADAVIAATPTGSTAYSLAAGGPILPPELRNILLVAVAPHLSIDRAIVLAEGSSVTIQIKTEHDAVVSIDGQPSLAMANGDYVKAHASEHTIQFVRFQDPGYFYRNLTPHMNKNPSTGSTR